MTDEKRGYHDLPLLKKPVWTWEVPAYFVVGGTAGAAAVIALTAQMTRADRKLVRNAKRIAAAGAILSAPLLIADLGRPERFLYMLRIFKPQSAMSVGAWTLSVFGAATTAAVLFDDGAIGDVATFVAAATGAVMTTYTGVLLGATSIPVWAKHAGTLPLHFGASAAASASSVLELIGHRERALAIIAGAAATAETYLGSTESASMFAAYALSGPLPLLLRLIGGKRARKLAAASAIFGSVMTRFAWVAAGRASADKYRPVRELANE